MEHGEKGNERYRLGKEAGEVTKKKLGKIVINHSAELWLIIKEMLF